MHSVRGNWLARFAPSEFHGAEPLQDDFTLFLVLVIGLTSAHRLGEQDIVEWHI
jgi:hypothetical protein